MLGFGGRCGVFEVVEIIVHFEASRYLDETQGTPGTAVRRVLDQTSMVNQERENERKGKTSSALEFQNRRPPRFCNAPSHLLS